MKKLLVKDLVGKSLKELVKMRKKLQEELYNLQLKNSVKALKQTHLLKLARRNIARVNTALVAKTKNI